MATTKKRSTARSPARITKPAAVKSTTPKLTLKGLPRQKPGPKPKNLAKTDPRAHAAVAPPKANAGAKKALAAASGQTRRKPGPKPKVDVVSDESLQILCGLAPQSIPSGVGSATVAQGEIHEQVFALQASVDLLHEIIVQHAVRLAPVMAAQALSEATAPANKCTTQLGIDLEDLRFQVDVAINRLIAQRDSLRL